MFLAITTVITTGLRLITTGKIQHLTMSKQLLIAFGLLDLEKLYQGKETLDAIQGLDRMKSKLSAKTFHNHFPEGSRNVKVWQRIYLLHLRDAARTNTRPHFWIRKTPTKMLPSKQGARSISRAHPSSSLV